MSEYPNVKFIDGSGQEYLSFDDWGLKLEHVSVSFPEPKLDMVDIPGVNGLADLTEINGPVTYNNRSVMLSYSLVTDYAEWHLLASRIAAALHGKKMKCILPDDKNYYYEGRFTLETSKDTEVVTNVIITGNVEPYKMEVQSSLEPWRWDTFSFVDGVIRSYGNVNVNGSDTLIIVGLDKPVVPLIVSSTSMKVEFEGETYDLQAGNNMIYDIVITAGENLLKFTGNGAVSVEYRGGIL